MKKDKIKLLIAAILIVIAVVISIVALTLRKSSEDTGKTTLTEPTAMNKKSEISSKDEIGKAGEEILYSEDLDYELSLYPASPSAAIRGSLINKMFKDSIILQSAEKDGLIKLDDKVFNARNKNYRLRLRLIDLAKQEIEKKVNLLEGKAVVIWFQNGTPGEAGYEKGRQIAFQKLTNLHQQVEQKKITIDQAITAVKEDESLIEVDTSYIGNAEIVFKAEADSSITIDPELDAKIKELGEGELSNVMEGKDLVPGQNGKRESFFLFAQVNKKGKGSIASFDSWYAENLKNYETTIH